MSGALKYKLKIKNKMTNTYIITAHTTTNIYLLISISIMIAEMN